MIAATAGNALAVRLDRQCNIKGTVGCPTSTQCASGNLPTAERVVKTTTKQRPAIRAKEQSLNKVGVLVQPVAQGNITGSIHLPKADGVVNMATGEPTPIIAKRARPHRLGWTRQQMGLATRSHRPKAQSIAAGTGKCLPIGAKGDAAKLSLRLQQRAACSDAMRFIFALP